MIASILKIEQTKLFGRRLYWIELAILVALIVLILAALGAVVNSVSSMDASAANDPELAQAREAGFWPDGLIAAQKMAASSGLGGILMIVLTGAVVAQEYAWGVLAITLSHGVPRPLALVAKVAMLLAAALLMSAVAIAVASGTSMLITVIMGRPLVIQGEELAQAALIGGKCVLTLLPYMALTLWLAISTRSTVAAIGAGIGAMLVEGIFPQIAMLLGGVWAQIATYLPSMLATHLLTGTQTVDEMAMLNPLPAVDPAVAAIGLAAYAVVFGGLALWSFLRQDLTA